MAEIVSLASGGPAAGAAPGKPDVLRPSEYTGLLLQAVHLRADRIAGASVLEIGTGSGVVLLAMAKLGAAQLSGVDIEGVAVERSRALLDGLSPPPRFDLHQGDMWQPFAGRRFDVIVANLPHFPAERVHPVGRLPSWSNSGSTGRLLLDPLLRGLATFLRADGIALLVHSGFVDLEASRATVAGSGLSVCPILTTLIQLAPEKLAVMPPGIRSAFDGTVLKQFGDYIFAETHVVEVTRTPPGVGTPVA